MFEMLEIVKAGTLCISLFANAWIDCKKQKIYLWLICITGLFGMTVHIFLQDMNIQNILAGISVGVMLLLFSYFTKESIGYGDGCLFMMTGIFLGFWENLCLLFLSCIFAGVTAAFFLLLKRKKKEDRLPFVPFVALACVLRFVFND